MELSVSSRRIDTTPLPEDQPVLLLHEARDYYTDTYPPFVTRNVGKNVNGTVKRIVLATELHLCDC